MQASPPLSRQAVLALAPVELDPLRAERYRGDTVTSSMGQLAVEDRATIRFLYTLLLKAYELSGEHLNDDGGVAALTELASAEGFSELVDRVSTLGTRLTSDDVPYAVKQSIHDVRGGSLMALIMHLDMALEGEALPQDVQRVFILARDHLKMMRNAFCDLDPERYNADLAERAHGIDLLRSKWSNVKYIAGDGAIRVQFHCDFDGAVSQRCMEFSALDRVIYNLVNNAAQHTANGRVDVVITPLDDGRETHLRFAVINPITAEQRAALQSTFGDELSELFRGGFTTGGHGIGMRVCADFVTHGYARGSVDQALQDRLLGIDLVDDHFVAWFHWPAVRTEASGAQAAK